eukprot:s4307_g8.t1
MPSQATVVNVFAYDTRRFKADGDTPDAETGKVEARLLLVYILPVHLVSPWPFWMRRMVQPGEELDGYRVPEWQRLQREVVFINTWSSQWDGQRHSEEVRTLMMNIRRCLSALMTAAIAMGGGGMDAVSGPIQEAQQVGGDKLCRLSFKDLSEKGNNEAWELWLLDAKSLGNNGRRGFRNEAEAGL